MTFAALYAPDEIAATVDDRAWCAAMLTVEDALAQGNGPAPRPLSSR